MKKNEILSKQAQLLEEVDFLAYEITQNERKSQTSSHFIKEIHE